MPVPTRKPATPAASAKPVASAAATAKVGGFKRPAAPTKPQAKPKSKYGGIACRPPRDPMPEVGIYRFKVTECVEGFNPGSRKSSFKAKCEVVQVLQAADNSNQVGDTVSIIFQADTGPGRSDIKAFCMGFAGFLEESEYDAYDPEGFFIEACTGTANEYTEEFEGVQPIIGRMCDVEVKRGGTTPDGQDWYRRYGFYTIDEEDQEVGIPQLAA